MKVAPRAGAWIETPLLRMKHSVRRSHPMRVRGLKQVDVAMFRKLSQSHPMRVRGLKPIDGKQFADFSGVAPHTGAWIETEFWWW